MIRVYTRLYQTGLTALLLVSASLCYSAFNNTTSGGSTGGSSYINVMSPTDFSSRVNTLKQQTKDSISQETKQLLTAKPTPTATANNTMTNSASPTPAQTTSTPTSSAAPAGNNAPSYTGFGTPPNKSAPQNSQGSSGWNVKY